jgi:hypothetical protein
MTVQLITVGLEVLVKVGAHQVDAGGSSGGDGISAAVSETRKTNELVVRGWCLLEPGAFKSCINGVGGNIVNPIGRVIDTSTREKWTREEETA